MLEGHGGLLDVLIDEFELLGLKPIKVGRKMFYQKLREVESPIIEAIFGLDRALHPFMANFVEGGGKRWKYWKAHNTSMLLDALQKVRESLTPKDARRIETMARNIIGQGLQQVPIPGPIQDWFDGREPHIPEPDPQQLLDKIKFAWRTVRLPSLNLPNIVEQMMPADVRLIWETIQHAPMFLDRLGIHSEDALWQALGVVKIREEDKESGEKEHAFILSLIALLVFVEIFNRLISIGLDSMDSQNIFIRHWPHGPPGMLRTIAPSIMPAFQVLHTSIYILPILFTILLIYLLYRWAGSIKAISMGNWHVLLDRALAKNNPQWDQWYSWEKTANWVSSAKFTLMNGLAKNAFVRWVIMRELEKTSPQHREVVFTTILEALPKYRQLSYLSKRKASRLKEFEAKVSLLYKDPRKAIFLKWMRRVIIAVIILSVFWMMKFLISGGWGVLSVGLTLAVVRTTAQNDLSMAEKILKHILPYVPNDPYPSGFRGFEPPSGSKARFLIDYFLWRARVMGVLTLKKYEKILKNRRTKRTKKILTERKYVAEVLRETGRPGIIDPRGFDQRMINPMLGFMLDLIKTKIKRGEKKSLRIRIGGIGWEPKELEQMYNLWNQLIQTS